MSDESEKLDAFLESIRAVGRAEADAKFIGGETRHDQDGGWRKLVAEKMQELTATDEGMHALTLFTMHAFANEVARAFTERLSELKEQSAAN